MKKQMVVLAVVLVAVVVWQVRTPEAKAQQAGAARVEYVGVRYLSGDRVMVVFPDGTAQHLSDLTRYQRPKWADDRVFNLTMAVNFLAKQGYEPMPSPTGNPDKDDVWMRRTVTAR